MVARRMGVTRQPAAGGRLQVSSHEFEGGLMVRRPKVLFLCTGNSCRSQMAEGWTQHLKADAIDPYSAGVEVKPVDSYAVKVMADVGVDISGQRSKHVSEMMDIPYDYVITVCSHARKTCPFFPGNVKRLHVYLDDPPFLTKNMSDGEEKLAVYRRIRDEIREFVERIPGNLSEG